MPGWRLRRAVPADAPAIWAIHTRAIRETASSHYPPESVAAWSGRMTPGSYVEPIEARVVLTEPLGAETLVTLEIGGHELVARCSASFARPPGASLPVYMDPAHMHLFDGSNGMALH